MLVYYRQVLHTSVYLSNYSVLFLIFPVSWIIDLCNVKDSKGEVNEKRKGILIKTFWNVMTFA